MLKHWRYYSLALKPPIKSIETEMSLWWWFFFGDCFKSCYRGKFRCDEQFRQNSDISVSASNNYSLHMRRVHSMCLYVLTYSRGKLASLVIHATAVSACGGRYAGPACVRGCLRPMGMAWPRRPLVTTIPWDRGREKNRALEHVYMNFDPDDKYCTLTISHSSLQRTY